MAQLLCPVDYNWKNPQYVHFSEYRTYSLVRNCRHRAYIRNYHPDYLVTTDCWPYFLYEKEVYDPEDSTKGLFKNILLIRVRH